MEADENTGNLASRPRAMPPAADDARNFDARPQGPSPAASAGLAAGPWPQDLPAPAGQPLADPGLLAPTLEGHWQQDADGRVVWASTSLAVCCGQPAPGRPPAAVRPLCDVIGHDAATALDQALAQGTSLTRVALPGGASPRWLELSLVRWADEQGRCQGARGRVRDITAQVALEERMQRAERSLLALIETASEGIAVVQDQVFRFLNRNLQTFLGIPAEQLLGRPFLDVIHPEDRPTLIENHRRRLAGETVPSRYEFRLHTQERGVRWLEMSGSVVDWEGRPATLTHIADITARKALEEQVRQMAFQDTLTGLANRRLFEERLQQALIDGRQSGQHGALLFLDLDAFKPLNDTLGHAAGDQMLVSVAQRLRHTLRATDVVARLGGDEFVVLLMSLSPDLEQARLNAGRVVENLRRALDPPHTLHPPGAAQPVDYRCTASLGLTVIGPEDSDMQAVLQRADEAMYEAKARDRVGRVRVG